MPDRFLSFTGCLVGAVFAAILVPAASGFGMLIVHLAAVACFVVPMVFMVREGDSGGSAVKDDTRVEKVEF